MGKFFSLTEEQKQKVRLARLGTHHSEETKRKMSLAQKGKHSKLIGYRHTEEARRNMSIGHMGNQNNLGHKASTETRAKMSATRSGSNNAFFGKTHSEETREKIRLSRLGKPTTLGRKSSDITRQRISASKKGQPVQKSLTRSATYKAKWQDEKWAENRVRRILQGQNIKPNKPERLVLSLLEEIYPKQWKYVGDGSFFLGRRNPDFVNVNGKKQVIELFGTYWHKGQNEQERADIFAQYGFATLVIWENELEDIEEVKAKLRGFCGQEYCQSRASRGSDAPGKCRDFIRSIPSRDKEKVQAYGKS